MTGKRPFGTQLTCFVGKFPEAHWDHMNHLRHLYETAYEPIQEEEVEAYGRHIDRLWRRCGEDHTDLLVVEPDIWPEQVDMDAMKDCDDLYCAHVYWLGARHDVGLGFTRFRWQLMADDPKLIERAANRVEGTGPVNSEPWHWRRMDHRINKELLEEHGQQVCRHAPVRHSHPYPAKDPLFS